MEEVAGEEADGSARDEEERSDGEEKEVEWIGKLYSVSNSKTMNLG